MSGRYTKLFSLPENLYAEGSPVIIEAGVLTLDNNTNRVFVQLKFRNISDKEIKALSVTLKAYYVTGKEASEPVKYQYLDFCSHIDEEFGAKTPVLLHDNTVRSFSVHVDEVVYADNTVGEVNLDYSESVPEQHLLCKTDGWNNDTASEFKKLTNDKCVYAVCEYKDLWLCSCGGANSLVRDKRCRRCGCARDFLKSITPEKAQAHINDTIYDDAVTKMQSNSVTDYDKAIALFNSIHGWKDADDKTKECEKLREELKQTIAIERQKEGIRRKKQIKKIVIAVSIFCICVILGVVTKKAIIPAVKYHKADNLISEQKYDEAIELLKTLGDKDSAVKIKECENEKNYEIAKKNLNNQEYTKAAQAFWALGNYKDCIAKLGEIYKIAQQEFENGNCDDAEIIFDSLNSFMDSRIKKAECQKEKSYQTAQKALSEGKLLEACRAFISLNEYKDSKNKIEEIYQVAQKKEEEKKFEEALAIYSVLKECDGYKNCNTKISDLLLSNGELINVGDSIAFGKYEQDNDLTNGKEDINWKVIAKEKNKILVISEKILDRKPYHFQKEDITWEKCSLRDWLNSGFLNEAFSTNERNKIAVTFVTADKNPDGIADSGNPTHDKIFLLSINEAEKYFDLVVNGKCEGTRYTEKDGRITSLWWLRTTGLIQSLASKCGAGRIDTSGLMVDDAVYGGVRPALWITIDK